MNRVVFFTAAACAGRSACAPSGPPAPVDDLQGDLSTLRTAFNVHPDRVRLVLLVSPT